MKYELKSTSLSAMGVPMSLGSAEMAAEAAVVVVASTMTLPFFSSKVPMMPV